MDLSDEILKVACELRVISKLFHVDDIELKGNEFLGLESMLNSMSSRLFEIQSELQAIEKKG